jgi:hypothetical protein
VHRPVIAHGEPGWRPAPHPPGLASKRASGASGEASLTASAVVASAVAASAVVASGPESVLASDGVAPLSRSVPASLPASSTTEAAIAPPHAASASDTAIAPITARPRLAFEELPVAEVSPRRTCTVRMRCSVRTAEGSEMHRGVASETGGVGAPFDPGRVTTWGHLAESQPAPDHHLDPSSALVVDAHGARAPKDARQHRDALLGECLRRCRRPPRSCFEITNCDLEATLSSRVSWSMECSTAGQFGGSTRRSGLDRQRGHLE